MPSTVDSLGVMLEDLLTAAVAALATTGKGAPELQYLSPGLPIEDFGCDQVIVFSALIGEEMTQPITPIPATGRRYARGRVNLPTLGIHVARCMTVTPPVRPADIPKITADALAHCQDGWALWNGITAALRAGTLFGGTCDDVHMDGLRARDPSGGLYGWTMTMRPELPGIPAIPSS